MYSAHFVKSVLSQAQHVANLVEMKEITLEDEARRANAVYSIYLTRKTELRDVLKLFNHCRYVVRIIPQYFCCVL